MTHRKTIVSKYRRTSKMQIVNQSSS